MISEWWKRKAAEPTEPEKPKTLDRKVEVRASASVTIGPERARFTDDGPVKISFTDSSVELSQHRPGTYDRIRITVEHVEELFAWLAHADTESEALRKARDAAETVANQHLA